MASTAVLRSRSKISTRSGTGSLYLDLCEAIAQWCPSSSERRDPLRKVGIRASRHHQTGSIQVTIQNITDKRRLVVCSFDIQDTLVQIQQDLDDVCVALFCGYLESSMLSCVKIDLSGDSCFDESF